MNSKMKIRSVLDNSLRAWHWWALSIVATIVSQLTMDWLNQAYEATGFPVSYFVGQTTFDATLLKQYWQVLINKGTVDSFIFVQKIDFLFMLTVFFSFGLSCMAIYRSLPENNRLKNFAWWMTLLLPHTATMDALENGVSFIMLSDPSGFADWLVYPYSSFAVVKFALFSITYLWLVVGILICVLNVVQCKIKRRFDERP